MSVVDGSVVDEAMVLEGSGLEVSGTEGTVTTLDAAGVDAMLIVGADGWSSPLHAVPTKHTNANVAAAVDLCMQELNHLR